MKILTASALLSLTVPACHLFAQPTLQTMLATGYEDVAEIKQDAEGGSVRARGQLGSLLAGQLRNADAFEWFAKAARQGDLECTYRAGHMLLFGAPGIPQDQTVAANPPQGVRLIFSAATNHHRDASYDLYRAYKDGRGVPKDLVKAYAWLQLYTDTAPPSIIPPSRAELNQFALQVDTDTSQEGKRLAALYRAGHWPELVLQVSPPVTAQTAPVPPFGFTTGPSRPTELKLSGITLGRTPLAMLNGKTLAVGETATIPGSPQNWIVQVVKIDKDSVLVQVEGETEPRLLHIN